MSDESMKQPLFSPNTAAAILAPAVEVLAGEIAAARKDYDRAIAHLDRAVRLEDSLVYTEPSEFHFPPRHALGAVLLEAGRAGRGRDRLLGGPAAQPRERLGAVRACCRRCGRRARRRTRR